MRMKIKVGARKLLKKDRTDTQWYRGKKSFKR